MYTKYFTRDEVVIHNTQDDMWVIVNGIVLNLTNLFTSRGMEFDSMNDVRFQQFIILLMKHFNAFRPNKESSITSRLRRKGFKLGL